MTPSCWDVLNLSDSLKSFSSSSIPCRNLMYDWPLKLTADSAEEKQERQVVSWSSKLSKPGQLVDIHLHISSPNRRFLTSTYWLFILTAWGSRATSGTGSRMQVSSVRPSYWPTTYCSQNLLVRLCYDVVKMLWRPHASNPPKNADTNHRGRSGVGVWGSAPLHWGGAVAQWYGCSVSHNGSWRSHSQSSAMVIYVLKKKPWGRLSETLAGSRLCLIWLIYRGFFWKTTRKETNSWPGDER